jgi:hypothetical protein
MSDVARNLILVNQPGWQRVEDFEEIARRIHVSAPDIRVFIADNERLNPVTRKAAARAPTLVVSPAPLRQFRPLRGRVYQGGRLDKRIEIAAMLREGLPVPRIAVLGPETRLDPAEWGPLVVLKPLDRRLGSGGKGVVLRRTETVCYVPPAEYPEGHPGRRTPMLVQTFIDTGPRPYTYRTNTLFGEALYCAVLQLPSTIPPLDATDEVLAAAEIASNRWPPSDKIRRLVDDADVLDLARRCHAALPDRPVMGVDIVREHNTGKLYVLELNPVSDTWQISSRAFDPYREALGGRQAMIAQFGAWDVAARVLVARTRADAI